MFLVLCVLGNEEREALVDTTLLEEPLKLFLEVKIKSVELGGDKFFSVGARRKKKEGSHLRADVETAALPIGLGGEVRRQFRILVERHVLEYEDTLLTYGIDAQPARDRRLRTACQRTKSRTEWTIVRTLVMVNEQRSGYDTSSSAETVSSPSPGSMLSSAL